MSRRRFVYRNNPETGLVDAIEVSPEYQTYEARPPVYSDGYMDGTRAPDGTDIGSRAKRRNYMRARGLADYDDFKGTFAKAAQERQAIQQGTHQREERREALARALSRGRK